MFFVYVLRSQTSGYRGIESRISSSAVSSLRSIGFGYKLVLWLIKELTVEA